MIDSAFVPGPPQWLTVREAAAYLDICTSGIYSAMSRKTLEGFRAPWNGRTVLITVSELERYDAWRQETYPWRFQPPAAKREPRRLQKPLFHTCPRCYIIVKDEDCLCDQCKRELAGQRYYAARVDVLAPAVDLARCYETGGL